MRTWIAYPLALLVAMAGRLGADLLNPAPVEFPAAMSIIMATLIVSGIFSHTKQPTPDA